MPGKTPLRCPICDKPTDFFADPLGPFCSSRCQQIDLGKWLGEDYRVSEPLNPEHFAEFENLEGPELDQPESPLR
jgi:endogenous inhibitor of DNA gyrase (YacG/DUF329 family)